MIWHRVDVATRLARLGSAGCKVSLERASGLEGVWVEQLHLERVTGFEGV